MSECATIANVLTPPVHAQGGAAAAKFAGAIDAQGMFDRGTGVLHGCLNCLESVRIVCWAAPAADPVSCECPGA